VQSANHEALHYEIISNPLTLLQPYTNVSSSSSRFHAHVTKSKHYNKLIHQFTISHNLSNCHDTNNCVSKDV
jgi:hypothetical protein